MTITFEWPNVGQVDFASLPEPSQRAIVGRGIAHLAGNEGAAGVVGAVKSHIAKSAEPARKVESVTTDEVRAYREANPEHVKQLADTWLADKYKALLEGTIGQRASGTGASLDPLTRVMRNIAAEEVAGILEAHGLKMPRGEDKIILTGVEHDRQSLISARLANPDHAPRIEREAKAIIAAKVKKAKALAEGNEDVAAALGL